MLAPFRLIIAFTLAVILADQLPAQQTSPAFEVASVRRNTSGAGGSSFSLPPTGAVRIINAPIRPLIVQAYQIDRLRLVDASDSPLLRDTGPKFDVEAKPADDAPPGQQRLMLQTLLADRFKLRVHTEKRVIPIYALTVARKGQLGPDLAPTDQDCQAWQAARKNNPQLEQPHDGKGRPLCLLGPASAHPGVTWIGNASPAARIATSIQFYVDRLLIDETGLTGNYAWRLAFALNPGSEHPSIFTAVEEQLGLKLEPMMSRELLEVLVVDSIELPTSN
jgi:uncharacterized protein (TIGR03435 family)